MNLDSTLFVTSFLGVVVSLIIVRDHKTWRELCLGISLAVCFMYLLAGDITELTNFDKYISILKPPTRPFIVRPVLITGLIIALMDKFKHA